MIGRSNLYELIRSGDEEIVNVVTSPLVKVDSLRRLLGGNRAGPT